MPARIVQRGAVMLAVLGVAGLAACSAGPRHAGALDAAAAVRTLNPAPRLPPLASLPPLAGQGRRLTALVPYELLDYAPLASSANGSAAWSAGSLLLAPDLAGGTAWAVFALPAFPLDGSIKPLALDGPGGPLWLGLSNYTTGRWEWHAVDGSASSWHQPYSAAANFVAPGGTTYVALLRQGLLPQSIETLQLTLDAELFSPPAPALVAEGSPETAGALVAKYPVVFDFSASTLGEGSFVSAEFEPQAGGPAQPVTDLSAPLQYVYPDGGDKTAALSITTEKAGLLATRRAEILLDLEWPVRELLVVYNSSIAESVALKDYYVSPLTGRCIDPDYALGLPLADSASFAPSIPRAATPGAVDFEEDILLPLKAFLDDPAHAQLKADVKYLLLLKGIPHQIQGVEDFSGTLTNTTCSAVDSELCLLNSYGSWPIGGYIWNGDVYENFAEGDANSFLWSKGAGFARGRFRTRDSGGGTHDLDYLVGRIDAYTYPEARAIIDRSRAADTSGQGWVILDSFDNDPTGAVGNLYDKMVQPVWPSDTYGELPDAKTLLAPGFIHLWEDITSDRLTSTVGTPPPGFVNSVIAYAGWGVNHGGGSYPSGAEYILNDLGWNWLPGACWVSYESFNGTAFSEPINRRGQGQVCDFLRMGGTCAIGNAWEPYTIGVGDERWVIDRYVHYGDRWIEAAYAGLCLLSWQEVVIGDPLCRVQPVIVPQ